MSAIQDETVYLGPQDYANFYLVQGILKPLCQIRDLIAAGRVEEALQLERVYIDTLPPNVSTCFGADSQAIDRFFEDKEKTTGTDIVQTKAMRRKFARYFGTPLALKVSQKLWREIYRAQFFVFAKSWLAPTAGAARSGERELPGFASVLSSEVE